MALQCIDVPKLPGLSTQTDGLASDADSSDNFKSLLMAHLLFGVADHPTAGVDPQHAVEAAAGGPLRQPQGCGPARRPVLP